MVSKYFFEWMTSCFWMDEFKFWMLHSDTEVTPYTCNLVAEKKQCQRLYFELKSVSTAAATTDLSAFGSYALRYCRVY